jgi:hypothetical protein
MFKEIVREESTTDEWIKKMWYIYTYNGVLLSHKEE